MSDPWVKVRTRHDLPADEVRYKKSCAAATPKMRPCWLMKCSPPALNLKKKCGVACW